MPITLRFTLTFQDFLNAQRLHAKANWWRRLNYYAIFMLPVLGVFVILTGNWRTPVNWPSATFTMAIGLFCVLFPLYHRFRIKRCYRRTRTGSGDHSFEFGQEKIRVEAENMSSEFNWKAVQKYRENKSVITLYIAPAKFIIVPKRVLTTEQQHELHSLLASQVTGKSGSDSEMEQVG
jgi:YcxB-like protein